MLDRLETYLANRVPLPNDQTLREEIASSITHGVGAALSSAAVAILVTMASIYGDAWRVVSLSVYGATMVLLYLASTLYHSFHDPRVKRFFRLADHVSIFLLIAGTYTPILLVFMRGPWGWTMFGLTWGLAICGIFCKLFLMRQIRGLSVGFYIAMGWIILLALRPALDMVPAGLVAWMAVGGMFYTLGVVFFSWTRIPYHHAIWHLFVLFGSACHFFGMLFYTTGQTV